MSRKYLWRVTATFTRTFGTVDEPKVTTWTTSRCYQSKAAAEHRAAIWREGRPEEGGYGHNGDEWHRPGIEKADAVVVERSAPIGGWTAVPA